MKKTFTFDRLKYYPVYCSTMRNNAESTSYVVFSLEFMGSLREISVLLLTDRACWHFISDHLYILVWHSVCICLTFLWSLTTSFLLSVFPTVFPQWENLTRCTALLDVKIYHPTGDYTVLLFVV